MTRLSLHDLDENSVPWRQGLLLVTAALCLGVYVGVTRSWADGSVGRALLPGLPGDLPAYAARFVTSFFMMGLVPLGLALLLGYRPRQLGLRPDWSFFRSPVWWILLVLLGSTSMAGLLLYPGLREFYPYSKTLAGLAAGQGGWFVFHAACYLLLYYLPWEILFRGVLVSIFLPGRLGYDNLEGKPMAGRLSVGLLAAGCQVLPTLLLHYPHDFSEFMGTIPFGLACAWMVLRYRTILPCLVMHAAIGIGVDAACIYFR